MTAKKVKSVTSETSANIEKMAKASSKKVPSLTLAQVSCAVRVAYNTVSKELEAKKKERSAQAEVREAKTQAIIRKALNNSTATKRVNACSELVSAEVVKTSFGWMVVFDTGYSGRYSQPCYMSMVFAKEQDALGFKVICDENAKEQADRHKNGGHSYNYLHLSEQQISSLAKDYWAQAVVDGSTDIATLEKKVREGFESKLKMD